MDIHTVGHSERPPSIKSENKQVMTKNLQKYFFPYYSTFGTIKRDIYKRKTYSSGF